MRRHALGRCLSLQGPGGANAPILFTMLALLIGGCSNSGVGTKHPDAGGVGQGGSTISASGLGGTGGVASSGGQGAGVSAASGGGLAGGSGAGSSGGSPAGGHGGSISSRIEGSSSGGSSATGSATTGPQVGGSLAGGTTAKGGSMGGNTGGAGGKSGGSAGTTGGNSGGKGGTSVSSASGGTAGAKSGGTTASGGATPLGGGSASGGATPTGGTSAGSGAIETALAPIITSFCTAVRHCCSLAGFSTTSLVDCESQFVKRNPQFGVVELGEATIDSKVVAACKAAYDEAATSCSATAAFNVCTGILVGKQGENAPCGKGGDPMIAGGSACDRSAGVTACVWTGDSSNPAFTGTCHKVAHGKKGDACLSTCESGDDCSFELMGGSDTVTTLCFEDEGFFCSNETDPASCQPLAAQGGSCSASPDACKSTDTCDSVSKTCKAASSAGQSCLYSSCLRHLSCGADKKCVEPFWELASEYVSCQGIAQIN